MNNSEFIKFIKNSPENEQLVKYSGEYSIDSILKDIVAMLNTVGGVILICELKNSSLHQQHLQNQIQNSIIPTAPVWVSTEDDNGEEIVIIQFWKGSRKPYSYQNIIYERVGGETLVASVKSANNLIEERFRGLDRWERQSSNMEPEDLDESTLSKIINSQKIHTHEKTQQWKKDFNEFLIDMALLSNAKFSNACLILFAKTPQKYLSQSRVRITQFSTDKLGATFTEKLFEGNIFHLLESIINYYENLQVVASKLNDNDWKRTDQLKYPPTAAFREGISNALIHRDYTDWSSNIQINIYPQKVEIINSGGLPNGITVDSLKKNHISVPLNPDIAHICYMAGIMERIGRGTNKILMACKEAGFQEPFWQAESNHIYLVFPLQITKNYAYEDLNDRQKKILLFLDDNKTSTVNQILAFIQEGVLKKVTDRTVRSDLSLMIESGFIYKRGNASNTIYLRTDKSLK